MVDLSIDIVGDRNVIRNLDQMPSAIQEVIRAKTELLTQATAHLVEQNIEDRLNEKSGKLQSSVEWDVKLNNGKIEGKVWIDGDIVPYAKAQEKGAVIPPHMIYPKNGKILAFYARSGEYVAATRVAHPGAVIQPKYFMRDAYRTMSPKISTEIKKAVVQGIRDRMRGNG